MTSDWHREVKEKASDKRGRNCPVRAKMNYSTVITPEQIKIFEQNCKFGWSVAYSCRQVGIEQNMAYKLCKTNPDFAALYKQYVKKNISMWRNKA